MSFIKWFKQIGIKKYGISFLIMIIIDYGVFFTDGGIQTAFDDPEIPLIIWILSAIAFIGFHVGIVWHMITTYIKQK